MNADKCRALDEFCDAVWLEDGLAKNTLDPTAAISVR